MRRLSSSRVGGNEKIAVTNHQVATPDHLQSAPLDVLHGGRHGVLLSTSLVLATATRGQAIATRWQVGSGNPL